jgi:hypothetical protein
MCWLFQQLDFSLQSFGTKKMKVCRVCVVQEQFTLLPSVISEGLVEWIPELLFC